MRNDDVAVKIEIDRLATGELSVLVRVCICGKYVGSDNRVFKNESAAGIADWVYGVVSCFVREYKYKIEVDEVVSEIKDRLRCYRVEIVNRA